MASLSAKITARLQTSLKKYQPILQAAKARDVNEADTVTIVKDILSEIFGYDKYSEVTSEYAIRGTYVDLAVKLDGKLHLLIEVKAINVDLEERHTKQAVDYGANQGVEWVVLTNGTVWRTYKITYGKPIGQELVMELDLLALNPRTASDLEDLFPLTKEGIVKSALQEHHEHRQATNRFVLGAILQSDAVLEVVRREVRRISPGIRIELEEIHKLLTQDVLKRDVVEGEKATEARQKVKRAASRRLRVQDADEKPHTDPPVGQTPPPG